MTWKTVTLDQFLTPSEIERARELYSEATPFCEAFVAEVIEPNLERINKALGQENDPRFLGYAVEYCLRAANKV